MTHKILVIDDDEKLLRITTIALEAEGFEVHTATSGREGLRTAFKLHPDLAILDIMMPGMDGTEVCRRLREFSNLPIIMLTALSTTSDIVEGLSAGADEYVTKPFRIEELVARVKACLRRRRPSGPANPTILVCGKLTIDLARHKVSMNGKAVSLTPTEFRLLSYLALNIGVVAPHRSLLVEVWGPEFADQVDYLHLYVRHLREKLEVNPSQPEFIKTERGIGYYLEEGPSG